MTSSIQKSYAAVRPPIEDRGPVDKPLSPTGVSEAPTVLETSSQTSKSEKIIEPGVFETMVVAIKEFIIFIFKTLWNWLCKNSSQIEKTESPKKQALEISVIPSKR